MTTATRTTKSSRTVKTAKPSVTRLPKGAARPKTCGQLFELFGNASISEADCKRLPRHHGDHSVAKPRGLMAPSERAKLAAKPKASKPVTKDNEVVLTIGGTKFRAVIKANGEAVLTKLEAATKSPTARRSAKPKVKTLGEAKVRRQVAAGPRRSKTGRFVSSGKPSARLA